MKDYKEKTSKEKNINNRLTNNTSKTDAVGITLNAEVKHAASQWFGILLLHHNSLSQSCST